jgi:hypothetical protein
MNSQDNFPSITRAQNWRATTVLLVAWVFVVAVVYQNITRPQSPTRAPFVAHDMLLYVTADDQVFTLENGVALQHVDLLDCPQRQIIIKKSETARSITPIEVLWQDTLVAYRFYVEQEFFINSSNIGLEIVFEDGESIALSIDCGSVDTEEFYSVVFVHGRMVYVADMSSGNATPLFILDEKCQLVWDNGDMTQRATLNDMAIPLMTGSPNDLPEGSVVAFSFATVGNATMMMGESNTVSIKSASGTIKIYSECAKNRHRSAEERQMKHGCAGE